MDISINKKISGNFSIITDFGCPFSCGFCITNSQNTKKVFSFNDKLFESIVFELNKGSYNRISISGGGEPLFVHNRSIKAFYDALFTFSSKNNIPIHVHTNLMSPNEYSYKFEKVTISINEYNFLKKFINWSSIENKRFVHVSDSNDLDLIKSMIYSLPAGSELTIKQMDSIDRKVFKEIEDFLIPIPNVLFLPEGDYNIYYVLNEQKVYSIFKNITFQ